MGVLVAQTFGPSHPNSSMPNLECTYLQGLPILPTPIMHATLTFQTPL
jgi:hypothetical protein